MEIRPKRFVFNLKKYWFNNSKFKTFFWNSNSILFENSEIVFCNVIKSLNKNVNDATLNNEVNILFGQESWHRHNHESFNAEIKKHYNIDNIEKNAKEFVNKVFLLNKKNILSYCVCFENMTVKITKRLINYDYSQTDKSVEDFWKWHAQEELEHGYVIKKLYKYFYNPTLLNKLHMAHIWIMYFTYTIKSMIDLYKQDIKNAAI